jgi:hypothetical protein
LPHFWFRVASTDEPSEPHLVLLRADATVCDCADWRAAPDRACEHILAALLVLA